MWLLGTGSLQEPLEGAENLDNIQQEPGSGHAAGPSAFLDVSLFPTLPDSRVPIPRANKEQSLWDAMSGRSAAGEKIPGSLPRIRSLCLLPDSPIPYPKVLLRIPTLIPMPRPRRDLGIREFLRALGRSSEGKREQSGLSSLPAIPNQSEWEYIIQGMLQHPQENPGFC